VQPAEKSRESNHRSGPRAVSLAIPEMPPVKNSGGTGFCERGGSRLRSAYDQPMAPDVFAEQHQLRARYAGAQQDEEARLADQAARAEQAREEFAALVLRAGRRSR
jgi:hypothetical protein